MSEVKISPFITIEEFDGVILLKYRTSFVSEELIRISHSELKAICDLVFSDNKKENEGG